MAWAGSPRFSPNHSTFYRRTNCKTIFPQMAPTDNTRKISRLDGANFGDFEGLKKIEKRSEEIGVDQSQTLR